MVLYDLTHNGSNELKEDTVSQTAERLDAFPQIRSLSRKRFSPSLSGLAVLRRFGPLIALGKGN